MTGEQTHALSVVMIYKISYELVAIQKRDMLIPPFRKLHNLQSKSHTKYHHRVEHNLQSKSYTKYHHRVEHNLQSKSHTKNHHRVENDFDTIFLFMYNQKLEQLSTENYNERFYQVVQNSCLKTHIQSLHLFSMCKYTVYGMLLCFVPIRFHVV